jgi:hypothetical protein
MLKIQQKNDQLKIIKINYSRSNENMFSMRRLGLNGFRVMALGFWNPEILKPGNHRTS